MISAIDVTAIDAEQRPSNDLTRLLEQMFASGTMARRIGY